MVTGLGAAYGTAKSAVGISSMGVMNPDPVMKNIIPVVMAGTYCSVPPHLCCFGSNRGAGLKCCRVCIAGILGIYGLIVGVILCQQSTSSFASCVG